MLEEEGRFSFLLTPWLKNGPLTGFREERRIQPSGTIQVRGKTRPRDLITPRESLPQTRRHPMYANVCNRRKAATYRTSVGAS